MTKIYWTSIVTTISLTLWAIYLVIYVTQESLYITKPGILVLLFVVNLIIILIIREKTY